MKQQSLQAIPIIYIETDTSLFIPTATGMCESTKLFLV